MNTNLNLWQFDSMARFVQILYLRILRFLRNVDAAFLLQETAAAQDQNFNVGTTGKVYMMKKIILAALALTIFGCSGNASSPGGAAGIDVRNSTVLVTGITGNQGGGVAGTLIEEGYQVRGLTRDLNSESSKYWENLGVEMVQGDFTDRASIAAALEGVDYLFVNIQEQIPDYVEATKYLLETADSLGVKHTLYSSNRRSEPELPQSASKTEIELYLRESGISYSTLRIPQMMSNFPRDRDMQNVLRNGVVGRGSERATFAYFAPDDLGLLAAAAFADNEAWAGREVNLAGDELTDRDLASLLSELSGLDIAYTAPPQEQDARWVANQGLSYDTEQLRAEFPSMMTLREYLIKNNYGENLETMSMLPLPPAPEEPVRGGPPPR